MNLTPFCSWNRQEQALEQKMLFNTVKVFGKKLILTTVLFNHISAFFSSWWKYTMAWMHRSHPRTYWHHYCHERLWWFRRNNVPWKIMMVQKEQC